MKIFVISLIGDVERRAQLKDNFVQYYNKFNFFNALNAECAKNKLLDDEENKELNMTLPEIACALSHKAVLETFILSGDDYILIMEDDMIGRDENIEQIMRIKCILPKGSILIAGSLDSLKCFKSLYGILIDEKESLYKIPKLYYEYIAGACSYLISCQVAKQIVEKHKQSLERADQWGKLLNQCQYVYYSPILKHPVDLKNSHLEQSRKDTKGKTLTMAILKNGVFKSLYFFIRKNMTTLWAKFKGYRSLYKL